MFNDDDYYSYVCAIVVTFNPDIASLTVAMNKLIQQVNRVIIVDNNSCQEVVISLKKLVSTNSHFYKYISLTDNLGIAEAQNRGIIEAEKLSASHVIFMDHDSIPADDMVKSLLTVEKKLLSEGVSVGALGPTLIDRRTQSLSGFVSKKGFFISRTYPNLHGDNFVEADFIISSGTLVRVNVLKDVGFMNGNYFIDHVDTEWCFRLLNHGYKIFGVRDAHLNHNLGENVSRIWLWRWREIPNHSDFRYYYIFRNTLAMIKTIPMSASWKVAHLYRLCIFILFFGILKNASKKRWRFILKGIVDGLLNRMGPYNKKG